MALSIRRAMIAVVLATAGRAAFAQSKQVDVYTNEQFATETRDSGTKPGATSALSSEILKRYPNHYSMYVVRHQDGQSEWHETFADVLFIVEGSGRLCTGGTMQDDKETAPGERRGTGLAGATCVPLTKGEVVHIPASVPHQVMMKSNETLSYFVIKVSEITAAAPASESH